MKFSIFNFLSNLFFPAFCINCQKEGCCLCQDCLSLIDAPINLYCPFCVPPKIVFDARTCPSCRNKGKKLAGLFFASPYQNFIIKKAISQFKYPPELLKDLARPLASLIIPLWLLINNNDFDFSEAFLIPIPLSRKKLKERGFNQAEEIAKQLSLSLKIPLLSNVLLKIKETPAQVELQGEDRQKNIKGVFVCRKSEKISGKKIILVDDVFTTGATMEECARVLKTAGAKEVWGATVARG